MFRYIHKKKKMTTDPTWTEDSLAGVLNHRRRRNDGLMMVRREAQRMVKTETGKFDRLEK